MSVSITFEDDVDSLIPPQNSQIVLVVPYDPRPPQISHVFICPIHYFTIDKFLAVSIIIFLCIFFIFVDFEGIECKKIVRPCTASFRDKSRKIGSIQYNRGIIVAVPGGQPFLAYPYT
jgi:hypothetical protein